MIRPVIAIYVALPCLIWSVLSNSSFGQEGPERLEVRIYRIDDLVTPTRNYPFQGFNAISPTGGLGGTDSAPPAGGAGGGGFGGGGGGFGGGGLGGGGGAFSVPDHLNQVGAQTSKATPSRPETSRNVSFRFTLDELIDAIKATVAPQSWDSFGGPGSIVPLGGLLLINQTAPTHGEINALLNQLRKEVGTTRCLTIRAYWLSLNNEQLRRLVPDNKEAAGRVVDRKALEELSTTPGAFRGQITCYDGQTVHLLAGRIRSMVSSVIPVVGQATPPGAIDIASIASRELPRDILTQRAEIGGFGGGGTPDSSQAATPAKVGFQPVISLSNSGAVLQVTPSLMAGSNVVVLDVQSLITQPGEAPPPMKFAPGLAVEQLNSVTQRLLTTLPVPGGKPVLVGGFTFEPGEDELQMYLAIEAIVDDQITSAKAAPK